MRGREIPVLGVYQILDANANRAREGLRVVEEVFRFVRKDVAVTRRLKAMRREVASIISNSRIEPCLLRDSRNSKRDPGRFIHGTGQMTRTSLEDILSANLHRVSEALRVLEEFSKLLDARASKKFKDLRFRFYDLEKATHEALT